MNKENNYYPFRNLILKKNYITRFFFGILINRTQFTKDGELNSSSSPAPPPYPSPAPGSFSLNDRYVFVSCNRLVLYWFRFLFCFFLCVSSWNRGSISPPFHRINPWYSTNHVHDRTCTFLLIRPPSPLSHVTQHIIISVTLKKKTAFSPFKQKNVFFWPCVDSPFIHQPPPLPLCWHSFISFSSIYRAIPLNVKPGHPISYNFFFSSVLSPSRSDPINIVFSSRSSSLLSFLLFFWI